MWIYQVAQLQHLNQPLRMINKVGSSNRGLRRHFHNIKYGKLSTKEKKIITAQALLWIIEIIALSYNATPSVKYHVSLLKKWHQNIVTYLGFWSSRQRWSLLTISLMTSIRTSQFWFVDLVFCGKFELNLHDTKFWRENTESTVKKVSRIKMYYLSCQTTRFLVLSLAIVALFKAPFFRSSFSPFIPILLWITGFLSKIRRRRRHWPLL